VTATSGETSTEAADVRQVLGRPRLVVAVVAAAALVASLTQTLVVPALPLLPGLLGVSPSATSWVVTATVVTAAAANPVLGRLADQFGLRRVLLATLCVFVVGSLACAVADQLALLVVGRALQGAATAAIPLGISLLSALLSSSRRAVGVALISAMLGLGGAIGLTISGLIVEAWGLGGLFLVPAMGGAAVLVAVFWFVPEPPRGDGGTRVDIPGGLLLLVTLALLLLPLSRGTSWGWTSPTTLGLFGAGVVATVVFGFVQLRIRAPMVDLRLAAARPVLLTNLTSMLVGFVLFVNFLGTTAVLQAPAASGYGFGLSMVEAGLAMLPGGLLMAGLAVFAARVVIRFGGRVTMLLGVALMIMGFLPRMFVHAQIWQVVAAAAVISGGTAIVFAAVPALIFGATPPRRTGAANGLNALSRSTGLAAASAVFGTLGELGGPGFVLFFDLGAVSCVVALGLALALPARGARTGAEERR